MSDSDSQAVNEVDGEASWPRRLNKVLIGVGVIAFGLIITDRLVNMFQADDLPEVTQITRLENAPEVVQELEEPVVSAVDTAAPAGSDNDSVPVVEVATEDVVASEDDVVAVETSEDDDVIDIDSVFGSRLVFVSASQPQYVITEDERRIDLGDRIDEQTILAGITNRGVVFDRNGDLKPVALPDLAAD